MRQYAESRAELGDHLLLYQIHSATVETGVLGDQGVLSELARLKEQAHRSIGERPTATRRDPAIDRCPSRW
jgi:aryl-alcohol dehydrogenase-like predicted oxidoreductase